MKLFMRFTVACAAAITALVSVAGAQTDAEDQESVNKAFGAIMASMPRDGDIIMTPWVSNLSVFGKADHELIEDPDVPGHLALRVTAEKGRNNWDASVVEPIGPAVKKGDLLVMVYYARVEEGSGEMPYNVIQFNSPPFNALIAGSETVTGEWEIYVAQGKADKNYKEGSIGVSMQLANADHTIDFGPVFVLNLGQ